MKGFINKSLIGLALVSALAVTGCSNDFDFAAKNAKNTAFARDFSSYTKPNKLIVKVSRSVADKINSANGIERLPKVGLLAFSRGLKALDTKNMTPLFPADKRFMERHREAGLDQWFVVTLNDRTGKKSRSLIQANDSISRLPGVEHVEPVYIAKIVDNGKPVYVKNLSDMAPKDANGDLEAVKDAYFNDRLLPGQWHYNNTGEMKGSVRGADIDLYGAWKITTGKPNVIVDVVDGGIDVNHEDLKGNLWVNEKELHGKPGVDDDRNGLVDDIYGYNFVNKNGTIIPHLHGTHVAGTVAAMNNNGIGVCGVAGGDGKPDTGVRLMSSQIFTPSPFQGGQDRGTDNLPAAIVYGADNGAVISQNSWGFQDPNLTDTPAPIKAAIDYFIKYAGTDGKGNQVGPMKGGVVIFAAGNDYKDKLDYPSSYPPVVSVAAMAPNFRRAGYSTHGNWVSLTAPGGDANMIPGIIRREYEVLSTFPGNKYGYLDGTSMACPHVSGVAALIVSKFGGPGFTNEDLKKRLLRGTNDIYLENPDKIGKLGVGLVDAEKCLSDDQHFAPDPVKDLKIVNNVSRLTVEWNTVKDKDDKFAFWYYVCASKRPFAAVPDIDHPSSDLYVKKVRALRGLDIKMKGQSAPLPIGQSLYITVIAEDRWGNRSQLGADIKGTVENGLPVVTMGSLLRPIHITGTETDSLQFQFTDPDNDPMTVTLEGAASSLTLVRKPGENKATVHVATGNLKAGKYTAYLVVTDSHGGVTKFPFTFEIYDNSAPVAIRPIDYVNLAYGSKKRIFLDRYFSDPDGQFIHYTMEKQSDSNIAPIDFHRNYIDIIGLKTGITSFKLKVEDTQKGVLEKDIKIVVSNSKLIYNVYPMQVDRYLNVYLNENLKGLVAITIYDAYGQKVIKRVVNMGNNQSIKIDMKGLGSGAYVMKVENKIGSEKVTIVKK